MCVSGGLFKNQSLGRWRSHVPRLLAFVPCERAIIAKDDDTVSLISVIQTVIFAVPREVIGQRITLPHQWSIFTYWLKEDGDEGITFEQRVEFVSPSNEPLFIQDTQFSMPRPTHSIVGRVGVMPVDTGSEGGSQNVLRLYLRQVGEPKFQRLAEFPLTVSAQVASREAVSK
jgi:hypothetical protein